jgi:hypothetical protein
MILVLPGPCIVVHFRHPNSGQSSLQHLLGIIGNSEILSSCGSGQVLPVPNEHIRNSLFVLSEEMSRKLGMVAIEEFSI